MSFLSRLLEGFRSLVLGGDPVTPEESRDSPRILCQYRVNLNHNGQDYKASIIDIGTTGLRLIGVPQVQKGDKLSISFPFAETYSEEKGFDVEVMWCRPDSGDELSAGVRYQAFGEDLKGTWVYTLLSEIGLTGSAVYQKRKHVRLATTQKVFLRDEATGRHILEGRVNNLSVGGALVESAFSMKRDRRVLALIGPSVNSPNLAIHAKVINSRSDIEEGCHLISLQFVEMNSEQLGALESMVIAMLEGRSLA
ncbi:MAG: PilZ domain-containing protein [Vulcanimicrobiota bacterium]